MADYPAIHLECTPEGEVFVSIEHEGKWVRVIDQFHIDGGITSHIVEPLGIRECISRFKAPERKDTTMPEAICLAALRALGVRVEGEGL